MPRLPAFEPKYGPVLDDIRNGARPLCADRNPTVSTHDVFVAILPGRIDVAVFFRSRLTQVRRLPFAPAEDRAEWVKLVRRSAAQLRTAVEEMGVTRCRATVLYRSPSEAVDVAGFGVSSRAEAVDAALLGASDALPYSAVSAVCEAVAIGRDAEGSPRQVHVVTAADREEVADAFMFLIESASLKFDCAVPFDAVIMARLVRDAMRGGGRGDARLYVGEFASHLAIANAGRLLFTRKIDLGLETLVACLTRPIRTAGGDEPVELSVDDARGLLHAQGIPEPDASLGESSELTGRQIIPLMQPVLQRFIVELRQSLRFGVSDDARGAVSIQLTGPGSRLPRFAHLVQDELDVEATVDPDYASFDPMQPGSSGNELLDAAHERGLIQQLGLVPRELASRRRTGRARRWLWTGAAAALAIVAFDAFRFTSRLDHARAAAESRAAELDDVESLRATGHRIAGVLGGMRELEGLIDAEVGTRVDYQACLHELSQLTPESIRFTTISLRRTDAGASATLTGYAFEPDQASGHNELQVLVDTLDESPLFSNVVLGHVTRGSIGARKSQQFEAAFDVVPVPNRIARDLASATPPEGGPDP
jgi:Tfp pilus assembly PilM family ATPase